MHDARYERDYQLGLGLAHEQEPHLRWRWGADCPLAAPIRDARLRQATPRKLGSTGTGTHAGKAPAQAVKPRPRELRTRSGSALARRAVRDYARAWRAIQAIAAKGGA